MYQVRMIRNIPGQISVCNPILWTGGRLKNARGACRMQIYSAFDMIMHHEFFGAHDYEVVMEEDNYFIRLIDITEQEIYHIQFVIEEF